jgi:WD40 repeat protein
MSSHQMNFQCAAKALLLLGGVAAALSCGRDVLVGATKGPLGQPTGGTTGAGGTTGTGGNDPCNPSSDAGTSFGGTSGYGGGIGTGGMQYIGTGGISGKGPAPVSCPTISTTPGALNACGRTIGIAYSPDGRYIATATETARPNIHIWRLSDGALLEDLDGHGGGDDIGSNAVAFSPDGTVLATAGNADVPPGCGISMTTTDPTEVKLWDVATGDLLRTVPVDTGSYAYSVRFSHDGGRLVTGGGAHAIQIWNVADASLLVTIPVGATYYDAQFSPDDARIVCAGPSTGLVCNASDGSLAFLIPGFSEDMNDAAYSPDGSEIAATGAGGLLRFFDAGGNLLQSFVAHTVNYTSRVVWVDNDHVVSDDWGGNIKSWTRDVNNQFGASGSWSLGSQAFGIAVSPDKTTLAVAGDGGFMFISYAPIGVN